MIPLVSTAEAFTEKRKLARQFIIFGVAVEITRDGKLTWEDGKTIGLGALSYYALSAPIVRQLASRGIYAAAGKALGWSAAIYFGGQALAAWIDPEEGAENFADFVWEPENMYERWTWTISTLYNASDLLTGQDRNDGSISQSRRDFNQALVIDGDYLIGPNALSYNYAKANLSSYVFDAILDPARGYSWFQEQGVGIPPWERELAREFAISLS